MGFWTKVWKVYWHEARNFCSYGNRIRLIAQKNCKHVLMEMEQSWINIYGVTNGGLSLPYEMILAPKLSHARRISLAEQHQIHRIYLHKSLSKSHNLLLSVLDRKKAPHMLGMLFWHKRLEIFFKSFQKLLSGNYFYYTPAIR